MIFQDTTRLKPVVSILVANTSRLKLTHHQAEVGGVDEMVSRNALC
jgi:hypothetical protein